MDNIEVLNNELDYLNLASDMVFEESANSDMSKIDKIKRQFNIISTHIDNAMVYIYDYSSKVKSGEDSTDYEIRLKNLIETSGKVMDNNIDSMSVYDNRDVYHKFEMLTTRILKDLENFVTKTDYESVDDVIKKRDVILDIIKDYDSIMDSESKLKVWLSPETVNRVCINALSDGNIFNARLKSIYMDITRLNNKVANITKNEKMDEAVKNELISSSLRLTREVASFAIKWNKHLMTSYPITKA